MALLIGIMGPLSIALAHGADAAFHSLIDDRFPQGVPPAWKPGPP
ncbi:hypothetical protein [Acidovorax sp. Root70]|nr:hypothetical protein [Acidovorax sp. Root70]